MILIALRTALMKATLPIVWNNLLKLLVILFTVPTTPLNGVNIILNGIDANFFPAETANLKSCPRVLTTSAPDILTENPFAPAPACAFISDSTFVTENGWRPGGGVMVSCVETCTGVKSFVIGKPNTVMIQMACETYGLQPEEIMAVGDRYETDIAGGLNFGAKTALVLSGYETAETAAILSPQPDLICRDLTELVNYFHEL